MPRKPKTQAKAVPTGGSYGEAQKLDQAQSAVPLPNASAPIAGVPQQSAQDAAAAFTPQNTPLTAPTNRPNEPITAGLPIGAGPGPDPFAYYSPEMDVAGQLQALYRRYPMDELAEVLSDL